MKPYQKPSGALRITFAQQDKPIAAGFEAAVLSVLKNTRTDLPLQNAWVGGPVPRNTSIPEWDELLARGVQIVWLEVEPHSTANVKTPDTMIQGWRSRQRHYFPLMRDDVPLPEPSCWLCTVSMDIVPEHEEEFNAWYSEEHISRIAKVPGVISARRFAATEGNPRYLALYHVEGPATLMSPAYAEATETPWSYRVRHFMRDVSRYVYRPAHRL